MAYSNIDKPNQYFNTKLYTGDGNTTKAITGVGFEPDFIWIKDRDSTAGHTLQDIVRGFGSSTKLASYSADEENDSGGATWGNYGYVTQADSDGFTVNEGANTPSQTNTNTNDYVSWNWLAGGTASSNTDGSITSSVSANTTSGFSIVSYTGNETQGATVGHGLGVTPKIILAKNRDSTLGVGEVDWCMYHESTGNTKGTILNTTAATETSSGFWNDTSPTSSVFSLGGGSQSGRFKTNRNGDGYIAYCFAEKKGFSKFGSYTGNGNNDGTFVYTGFKPAFVIIKRTDSTGDWVTVDTTRYTFNASVTDKPLYPNLSNAEGTSFNTGDFLSNGFKLRYFDSALNVSGASYIYMAFAESPLVGSNLVPNNAR